MAMSTKTMPDRKRRYCVTGTGTAGPLRYPNLTLTEAAYLVGKMSSNGVDDARAFDDEGREVDTSNVSPF